MSLRLIIKIGTNALTNKDGSLDKDLIKDLVAQISAVQKANEVLVVTSGAVGSGKSLIGEKRYDEVTNKQIFAAVGQVQLMNLYSEYFDEHGFHVAQVLVTKEDFKNRNHSLNMKNCLETLFREKIVPVMNENDVVAIDELMFSDNDELAGILSNTVNADLLLILSNVDGVYDKKGEVMRSFNYGDDIPAHILSSEKSSFGRGGMENKFKMAKVAADKGTKVVIANSRTPNIVKRIVEGEEIGTTFYPKEMGKTLASVN